MILMIIMCLKFSDDNSFVMNDTDNSGDNNNNSNDTDNDNILNRR